MKCSRFYFSDVCSNSGGPIFLVMYVGSKQWLTHTHTHTYAHTQKTNLKFYGVQFVSCLWVHVLRRRPSAPSYLLLLSPVVLCPSGGLPPHVCQSRDQLESYPFHFSLLSGTNYITFSFRCLCLSSALQIVS